MRRLLLPAVLAVTLSGAATGCAAFSDEDTAGLQLTASFYPLAWVTEQVSGHDVALLTTPGAEPHDLELAVRETAVSPTPTSSSTSAASSPPSTPRVDEIADGATVDAADASTLEPAADGDPDPHFWQDPLRMADLGDAVADALAGSTRPRGRLTANAAALRADLSALDQALRDGLADCERHTIVVSHDAFGYLAKLRPRARTDHRPLPRGRADAGPPGRAPGPGRAGRHHDGLRRDPGQPEAVGDPRPDIGLLTDVLDPLEGLTDESATRTTFRSCAATWPPSSRPTDVDPRSSHREAVGRDRRPTHPARHRPCVEAGEFVASWAPTAPASRRWSGP